ncbi:LLM class flavin-dependent oxidoreductase [Nocardia sp. CA2R105]|uniref:LLM class flavin-dependent oxidoreductase n=1 Tax=Nocardia coffeae TaxID=2873381 RepID=UPI001CA69404|nr:LLM class flavin-dependent oxidoreductase [Nocardia coffeae]MBY8856855.1 LLM class flavin-dependent oxidoreductase [Nocardia coffeae]
MKFSMIFEAQVADPTPEREREIYLQSVEQAIYAEEMGFDGIWAVEHHGLEHYSHMTAPELFLATVAAKTHRIRLGHGAVCMPFNYNFPTRVAERAAFLDVLSGGRVNLGAARGGTKQEAALCNVDTDRTAAEVEEALRIIGSAWRADDFEWHGKLLDLQAPKGNAPLRILPRPIQRPHPPLYLASTKPDTVVRSAELGVGALIFGFAGLDSVEHQHKLYRDRIATRTGDDLVSDVVNDQFVALCPTIVLDDGQRAKEVGARGQRFFGESIGYWHLGGERPPSGATRDEDNVAFMRRQADERANAFDRGELPQYAERSLAYANFNIDHAYGTAQTAIDYVTELERIGVDEVLCLIQMGTVSQLDAMETIRQWGHTVIPHFRAERAARNEES